MEKVKYRELKSQKEFLKMMFANIVSRFGDSLDTIAYSWIMYEVTGSESLMAFIVGLNYLPTVLLMPFIGAWVDRLSKKRVMVIADIMRFCIVMSIVTLYLQGALTVPILIGATLLTSTVECFRIPASGAIVPLILDKKLFKLGKGASFSTQRISELVGFALAGGIITIFDSKTALIIDAITFLISAVLISFIKYTDIIKKEKTTFSTMKNDYKEGLDFVKKSNVIKVIILVGVCCNFGSMTIASFLTIYVAEYLQMGASALSYTRISMSIGLVIGSFFAPKITFLKNSTFISITSIAMSASVLMLGVVPSVSNGLLLTGVIYVCMWLIGFSGGVINVVDGAVHMKATPEDKMGRVSAIVSSSMMVSLPVTSFICAALATRFDVLTIMIILGGLVTVLHTFMFITRKYVYIDE